MTEISIDFDGINAAALAACPGLLQRWFPAGRLCGKEFKVGNLAGDAGKSLSINITSGRWSDFATGESGGDLVSLYAGMNNLAPGEAAMAMATEIGFEIRRPTHAAGADDNWQPIMPPAAALPHHLNHSRLGKPDHVYIYRDDAGAELFAVCRWDATRSRSKVILPLTYGVLNGVEGWHHKHLKSSRPLYGLNGLAEKRMAVVLVVEGEKAALAAQRHLPEFAVITWPGGSSAVRQAEWSVLSDREVLIWPDADRKFDRNGNELPTEAQPGIKAAEIVAQQLDRAGAASIEIIDPPADVADGWDLADAEEQGWTDENVRAWIVDHRRQPEWPVAGGVGDGDGGAVELDEVRRRRTCPLRPLGHKKGTYWFLSPAGEMRDATHRDMTENGLASLVDGDLSWFYEEFPKTIESTGVKSGFNHRSAANYLMRRCCEAGPFDPSEANVRGPGVWGDGASLIIHCGQQICVDGEWVSAGFERDEIIYPVARRIARPASVPESREAGERLEAAFRHWNYASAVGPLVMTGFTGAALLGAATRWRAHVFTVGPYGSGKSWLVQLISAALGGGAHPIGNNYTEAGLRQAFTTQSLVLILDEAEGDEGSGQMSKVIGLLRNMSGSSGARVLRGSAGGQSIEFHVTGAAYLSSVLAPPLKPQDLSRITIVRLLELEPGPNVAVRAEQVLKEIEAIRTLSPALWARAIGGFHRYIETFETYRSAFLAEGASPRHAEQIATLAAGRDLLVTDFVPEADALAAEVARWMVLLVEAREDEDDGEGVQCLNQLFTSPADTWRSGERKTIGELIMDARDPGGADAREALGGFGLKLLNWSDPETITLLVANRHVGLERIYKDTRWASALWRDALLYQVGEIWIGPKYRFAGIQQRSIRIYPRYLPERVLEDTSEHAGNNGPGYDETEK